MGCLMQAKNGNKKSAVYHASGTPNLTQEKDIARGEGGLGVGNPQGNQ